MLHIFLPEELPWENKGEAAILFGMLEAFRELGPFRLTLPTVNPADLENYQAENLEVLRSSMVSRRPITVGLWLAVFLGVVLVGRSAWLRRLAHRHSRALAALLEADVILIGHDNFFAYVGVRSLLRYLTMMAIAKRLSARLVVLGASIGPLSGQKYPVGTLARRVEEGFLSVVRPLFKHWVLERVDLITLREEESLKFVDSLPVREPRRVITADLAFLMPEAPRDTVINELVRLGLEPGGRLLAITVDRWVAHRLGSRTAADATRGEREARMVQMLARLVRHAVVRSGFQALLVPHATGPEPFQDDRTLLRAIRDRLDDADSTFLLDFDAEPQLLKGLLGQAELVVGTRTHSLIAATSLGVPVLALTHPGRNKTNGIIGQQMGQMDSLVDVESLWSPDALVPPFETALARAVESRTRLRERIPVVLAEARRNGTLLGDLFPERSKSIES